MTAFSTGNSLAKFHREFAKILSLILPIFSSKFSFPKSIQKVPAQDAKTHSEPSQTSKMELLVKIVNNVQSHTKFAQSSILDV